MTLFGKTSTDNAREAAERTIAALSGVRRVDNLIQVVPEMEKRLVQVSDQVIKEQIADGLASKRALRGVDVLSVDRGVVVLGGKVEDLPSHVAAAELADLVAGVRRVESRVTVDDEALVAAYDDLRDSGAAGHAVLANARTTIEVKLRLLADENIAGKAIHVDTRNGVLTLFGRVASEAAKSEASELAQAVAGVSSVHNELIVDKKLRQERVPSGQLEAHVKRLLSRQALADIGVEVHHGVVKLTGTVDSTSKKAHAALVSSKAKGARAVKNELVIAHQPEPE